MTEPQQLAEASKAYLDWLREHNYEVFLMYFTDRELELAKFCNAYADVSFARIMAGVPLVSELEGVKYDKYGPFEIATPAPYDPSEELTSLIERGLLDHKLDATQSKLVRHDESAWTGVRGKAMAAAAEIERELLLGLHRVNVVLAGLEVNDHVDYLIDTGMKSKDKCVVV